MHLFTAICFEKAIQKFSQSPLAICVLKITGDLH